MVQFISEQQIQLAIEVLRRGGIAAFPTDTVYGLGAAANMESAIEMIYQVKRRPRSLPFPLLLAEITQIAEVAESVPGLAWHLAERFLPGGLTLVLPKSPGISQLITAGGNTVAVRIPAHPIPRALCRGLGMPIIGTSANLSGQPNPVTASEVYNQLGERVDLIIDGGRCPGGIESTVVDVSGETPKILREGAVPRKVVEEAIREFMKGS